MHFGAYMKEALKPFGNRTSFEEFSYENVINKKGIMSMESLPLDIV